MAASSTVAVDAELAAHQAALVAVEALEEDDSRGEAVPVLHGLLAAPAHGTRQVLVAAAHSARAAHAALLRTPGREGKEKSGGERTTPCMSTSLRKGELHTSALEGSQRSPCTNELAIKDVH